MPISVFGCANTIIFYIIFMRDIIVHVFVLFTMNKTRESRSKLEYPLLFWLNDAVMKDSFVACACIGQYRVVSRTLRNNVCL